MCPTRARAPRYDRPVADQSSRRAFLRDFARHAARGVREAANARDELSSLGFPAAPPTPPALPEDDLLPAPAPVAPRAPARPSTRALTEEELLALAAGEGLLGHDEALLALARRSVRLTPLAEGADTDSAGALLGGVPALAGGIDWPTWAAGRLSAVAQLDLADPALAWLAEAPAPVWPFPRSGRLLLWFDGERAPSGLQAVQRGAARAVVEPDGALAGSAALPLVLSPELTLPRVWSAAVQALDLSADDQEAYARVRTELALRQGVEPNDDGGRDVAYHRLLGYPDDTTGTMGRVCELTARGLDADPPSQLDLVSDEDAARWRLLAQLTVEPPLLWKGEPGVRLFVWIAAEDLAAGELDRIWAIPR